MVTLLLVAAFLYWRNHHRQLGTVFRNVAHEALEHVVIPDGLGGEIHIDWVLLTPEGLAVIEVKPYDGTVFCGDTLERWAVMHDGKRREFPNPLARLKDRIASVRTLVPDVPVTGWVLFTGAVDFPHGQAESVITTEQLRTRYSTAEEFTRPGVTHAVGSFYDAWQQIRRATKEA